MIFGKTLSTSPYIGLGGELNDVAHLMKDQVRALCESSYAYATFMLSSEIHSSFAPGEHGCVVSADYWRCHNRE